jgi:hypothetical protein
MSGKMTFVIDQEALKSVLQERLQGILDPLGIATMQAAIEAASVPAGTEAAAIPGGPVYTQEELATRQARESVYGDPMTNHQALGMMWAGLILQARSKDDFSFLPPHLVCLMQVAVKLSRLARTPNHEDSYHDAHVYLKLAQEIVRKSEGTT